MAAEYAQRQKEMKLFEIDQEPKGIPEVYIDMDGVLADFFGAWAKLAGKDNYRDIEDPETKLQLIRDNPTFWIDLDPLSNAGRLLGFVKKNFGRYKICSSPLAGDPNSEPQKRKWVAKYLSAFPPDEVIITHNKPAYATQADGTANILIDDYGKNIAAWGAAGGIAIKHKNHKLERTLSQLKDHMSA